MKKPAAGGGAAGFSKRTDQHSGRRSSADPASELGRRTGRSHIEALREEVHRFDELTIQQSRSDRRAEFATQPCSMREAKLVAESVFGGLPLQSKNKILIDQVIGIREKNTKNMRSRYSSKIRRR